MFTVAESRAAGGIRRRGARRPEEADRDAADMKREAPRNRRAPRARGREP